MDHHLGKPNKSPALRRINHDQHRRPTDYTERAYRHRRTVASSSRHRPRHDLHRQGRTIASSSWCPSRRPTSTHRLTSRLRHLGWTGGFAISSSTYSGHFGVTSRPAPSRWLGRGLCLGESTFTSIVMPSFYRQSGNGCAERVPILGITFLLIATTNKPGAINPSIFCLCGFIFLN